MSRPLPDQKTVPCCGHIVSSLQNGDLSLTHICSDARGGSAEGGEPGEVLLASQRERERERRSSLQSALLFHRPALSELHCGRVQSQSRFLPFPERDEDLTMHKDRSVHKRLFRALKMEQYDIM
ncbi:hypothetical protein WMY93_033096 [Mugilogobius chulae]|uniref:Uncharacterized protein n=1 Tax=Mugilogobius chulae TaxID=88201 RepID=A0AAW0MM73_9GOBI